MDLSGLTRLGPFFEVSLHRSGAEPAAGWRPMAELVEQPGVLLSRIEAVRRALAAGRGLDPEQVELRVAASVAHLGLVARLVAPALATATLSEEVLDLTLSRVWWQDRLGGPVPLSVEVAASRGRSSTLLDNCLAPLTLSVSDAVAMSARVLWGNIASGLNSAVSQIALHAPGQLETARRIATELLQNCSFGHDRDAILGPGFRRSSCCLIYRVSNRADVGVRPSRSVCGDCVLRAA